MNNTSMFAQIDLHDPDGNSRQVRLSFPISIGRDTNAGVVIDQADTNVSRSHAVLDIIDGRVILEDTSTNGTLVHGRLLKRGEQAQLAARDGFQVGETRIELVVRETNAGRNAELLASLLDTDFNELNRFGLRESCLFVRLNGDDLEIEPMPNEGANQLADDLFLMVTEHSGQVELYLGPAAGGRSVTVNNYPPRSDTLTLQPLDSVGFNQFKIEILPRKGEVLRCHNTECHLLNEYRVLANCRWCGTRLAESRTRKVSWR